MNTFRIADLWVDLMIGLGYDRFAAQGGDFGASVSTILGLRHPKNMIGVHLNYIPGSYPPDLAPGTQLDDIEKRFLDESDRWYVDSGAYAHLQRNTPQTAAYGRNHSPVALAAWIVEKFRDTGPDRDGDVERRFTWDELLSNVTLYWMTETHPLFLPSLLRIKKTASALQAGRTRSRALRDRILSKGGAFSSASVDRTRVQH